MARMPWRCAAARNDEEEERSVKIVCSANMPFAKEAFGTLGDVAVLPERAIAPADVRDADILAIRSTTKINEALLAGSRVRFVGTATIGTDHMDLPYLERQGIAWCYSPGCNANSVSEYLTSALLCLATRHGLTLAGKTVGVIGVGNVGTLVVKKAETLGMRALQNDPPREREWRRAGVAPCPFVPLEQVLAESDVVTLHVPLTREGPDATARMAGERFFAALKPGAIFVNAARGGILETDALLAAMDRGIVSHAVLDTWEGEPAYRLDAMARADLGTPHIAGHSFEGKAVGTEMVYRAACRFLGRPAPLAVEPLYAPPPVPRVAVSAAGRRDEDTLWEIVRQVYDIREDDRRLREFAGPPDGRATHFDRLRKHYPMRREFRFTRVAVSGASPTLRRRIADLGFVLEGGAA
jgi:erythronate-4-phosphate dehydrogenase